jgi:hypothetical protein
MNIQPELLALKKIDPLKKLILGLILDTHPMELLHAGGCDKTCTEIGKELGKSAAVIRREINELIEHDLITSEKGFAWRRTNVTQRFLDLLEGLI